MCHTSQSLFPVALITNSLVHVVMYYYYLWCAIGVRPRWKRLVTDFQIVQFVFSFGISSLMLYYHLTGLQGCGAILGWCFNAFFNSYLLARFLDFHGKSYDKKRKSWEFINQVPRIASNSEAEGSTNGGSRTKEAENKNEVQPFIMPTVEEVRAQEVWNNCVVRSVASGVMGGGLGLFMGLFLGALDNPITWDEMTGKQQFIYTAKQMGGRSWSSCKTFAVMGLVFSAAECVVEKVQAKHDMTNTLVAGCATGGTMSARGGPKAACVGCAGFAAFSGLIEKFLDRHH